MIFGWIGCVTVAIIMARFTRDLWPEKKLFGTKYWFVVHRYLMIIGWLAIVASYVVIFVQFGGWTHTSSHSVMGIVAGILATLQIGNSFLRPGPDSPHRWIFDYGHWFIGNTAHILALANIINSGLKRSKAFLWLLLAYLFVYLLFSDLLKKLENRIRGSSFSKRTPVVLQAAVAGAVLTVASITTALIAIMFTS
ncbi:DOMON domain-containing protein frrs1L, partial [Tyrophagus putrescentiae]